MKFHIGGDGVGKEGGGVMLLRKGRKATTIVSRDGNLTALHSCRTQAASRFYLGKVSK
jgi:hypothetical protein